MPATVEGWACRLGAWETDPKLKWRNSWMVDATRRSSLHCVSQVVLRAVNELLEKHICSILPVRRVQYPFQPGGGDKNLTFLADQTKRGLVFLFAARRGWRCQERLCHRLIGQCLKSRKHQQDFFPLPLRYQQLAGHVMGVEQWKCANPQILFLRAVLLLVKLSSSFDKFCNAFGPKRSFPTANAATLSRPYPPPILIASVPINAVPRLADFWVFELWVVTQC